MKLHLVVTYLFIGLLFQISHSAASVVIQKPSFTISLPDGWTEIPQEIFERIYDELKYQAPTKELPKYDYGFQLESSQNWMEYPYILVQVNNSSRIPAQQFKTSQKIDLNEKIKTANAHSIISNAELGKTYYDEENNIFWVSIQSELANGQTIQAISGLIPTETGYVQIHAYSSNSTFASYLPIFRQIITSTAIPPGLVYKSRWLDSNPTLGNINWQNITSKAIAGGIIAIIIAFYAGAFRKKKNSKGGKY